MNNNLMIYRVIYGKGRSVYQSIFCDKIVEATDKAFKMRISTAYTNGKEYYLWFPKKALVCTSDDMVESYKLAKWFTVNDYLNNMFERFGTVNA